jgi:hypothetical protein
MTRQKENVIGAGLSHMRDIHQVELKAEKQKKEEVELVAYLQLTLREEVAAFWKHSSEINPRDKRAVVGVLGNNNQLRPRLIA